MSASVAAAPRVHPVRRAPPRALLPWRDRAGRFSVIRLLAFALLSAPGVVLVAQWAAGSLGAEPIKAVLHEAGLWAVRITLLALAIAPLRRIADWPRILLVRRMVGLFALGYAVAHLLLFVALQNYDLAKVAAEIAKRIYLWIGLLALLGLTVLGVTSTDGWIRRLGRNWKRLHRLIYPLLALAMLHFFLQSKADVTEAVATGGVFLWLVLWRLMPGRWEVRALPLLGLAVVAALATAGLEYLWYALATNIPAGRVLSANLDVAFGLRPAPWVAVAGLAVAFAATLHHWRHRPDPRLHASV